MSNDITLRWCAPTDADVTVNYAIYTDKATSGVFVELATQFATDRGDGAYTPYATTLNGDLSISSTTVVLTSGTNFAAGAYVMVGKEMILLGTKDTHTYTACTRGAGGTLAQAQANGSAVLLAHENYIDSNVTFEARHCIRYKVQRRTGQQESISYLTLAVLPSLPPDASLCTVYGVVQSVQGAAVPDVAVTLTLGGNNNLDPSTGELYAATPIATTTTDDDGYFEFFIPRSAYKIGASTYELLVGEDGLEWEITTVPDVAFINFLEL